MKAHDQIKKILFLSIDESDDGMLHGPDSALDD